MSLLVLYLSAQVLSRPNGLFSVPLLLTPRLVVLMVPWVRSGFGTSTRHGWERSALVVGAPAGAAELLLSSQTFRARPPGPAPRARPWPRRCGGTLDFPLPVGRPALFLSGLAPWGLLHLARRHGRARSVAGFALTVLVHGSSIGPGNDLGNALTAPQYGSPDGLAALMPVLGVPWAAVVLEQVAPSSCDGTDPGRGCPGTGHGPAGRGRPVADERPVG